MPLALDPNQTFEYVLETDREKPKGKQPTFVFRFRSVEQWAASERTMTMAKESSDGDEYLATLCEVINEGLTGWKNMVNESGSPITLDVGSGPVEIKPGEKIPYHPDNLKAIVVVGELLTLYHSGLKGGLAVVEDLKKSASRSPSSTDESAADAEAEPSTANADA